MLLIIPVLRVPAEYFEFLATARGILEQAQQLKGDKKSVEGNERGHQKTPAMIQAVLCDAIEKTKTGRKTVTPARGGFADVGLHTGCMPRNRSWPLVRSVLQVQLEAAGLHVALFQAHNG